MKSNYDEIAMLEGYVLSGFSEDRSLLAYTKSGSPCYLLVNSEEDSFSLEYISPITGYRLSSGFIQKFSGKSQFKFHLDRFKKYLDILMKEESKESKYVGILN